jgi:predicted dehydrogenase
MNTSSGMNYAPKGNPAPVVKPGEFVFAAAYLDHGHIYGQCNGLIEAGADLRYVFDPDPTKVAEFLKTFPEAKPLRSEEELLDQTEVQLVAAAGVPCEHAPIGFRVMEAGKDYFTDKTPFTRMDQLEQARETVKKTGRKYAVYFSERLHVECAEFARQLIVDGTIGRVLNVIGMGPHRMGAASSRPPWFFEKEKYGGILCDIGSHQFEQFLTYAGAADARVNHAAVANYDHKEFPELEDFGEASLVADNGATNHVRIDWFTPDGLRTWGDGRTFIVGTKGYIEMRKYVDVAAPKAEGDHLYLVTGEGEQHFSLTGKVGFPFFGQLILDCLNRSENAMTQEHAFKAGELALLAQAAATRIE